MEEATEEIAESAINDAAEINKKIFIKENIGKAGTTTTKNVKIKYENSPCRGACEGRTGNKEREKEREGEGASSYMTSK